MKTLCRTYLYAKYLLYMRKLCPAHYSFFPHTWIFPREHLLFLSHKRNVQYILKPLNKSKEEVLIFDHTSTFEGGTPCVVQIYVSNPLRIDGRRFDVRLFVCITSCGALLRVFLYNEGVVRVYNKLNQRENVMYISELNALFKKNGYNTGHIWGSIESAIVKTIIAINPHLTWEFKNRKFSTRALVSPCFQLIQLDLMLDEHLNPYVLKVKDTPCIEDLVLKRNIFYDTLMLCDVQTKETKHRDSVKQVMGKGNVNEETLGNKLDGNETSPKTSLSMKGNELDGNNPSPLPKAYLISPNNS
ncbi:tubulin polyglutamylase TTLL6-like [Diaphorina citri]|uniref:Tubulin polyglutamylase TTLL6-like n=1 Tax=Diaphorina citri TaxID=121845 RepID=A0A3Q0JBT9_DIACI|nr:tubulin polyglutamylase TTLL6-like [Diaphorina citri]